MPDAADRLAAALSDRYRIERELGAGGMATVYLAHDLKHEREVAIKVLREDLSASLGSGRFLREIKIAAQLQHPHILPLLDSGEADGFLFFVMPYIKGQSLRERLAREGELPVHEAVRLITEVVDALMTAHEHGVVHRDIKPDNVMLTGRHALVTDFGVAKAISEATGRNTVTTLGVAVGTPTYMSPEQAAADPHVDHRSDIYSVGVMAYEMLSGRPPFTGSTPQQVLAAHVTEAPDPVSKRRQAIPPALEQIVMKCLAKRPADRFQTAAELHAALEPLATPSTGITPTETRPIEAVRVRSKAPLLIILAGVAAAAIVFAATRGRSSNAAVPAPITMQETTSGEAESASIAPDGTRFAYATKHCDDTGRCLYDLVVQDIGGAGTLTVASGATGIYSSSWSPDGRFLLMSGSYGPQWGAYLVPATVQGRPQYLGCCSGAFLVNADSVLIVPNFLPGDTVAYLRVLTTSDLQVRDSIRVAIYGVGLDVAPSPDGQRLALTIGRRNGPVIQRMVRRNGRVTDSIVVDWLAATAWTPDGAGLLLSAAVPGMWDGYNLIERHLDGSGRFSSGADTIWHRATLLGGTFHLTRDGGTLVYVHAARSSSVIALKRPDLATTRFTQRVLATSTAALTGSISPDGHQVLLGRLVAGEGDHARVRLSLLPADSGAEVPVSPPLDTLASWSWMKDRGAGILYSFPKGHNADQVMAFDLASGRSEPTFTLPDSTANLLLNQFSDGRFLAHRPFDRQWLVLSPTGTVERRLMIPTGMWEVGALAWSPSGDEIAIASFDASTEDSVVVYRIRISDGASREVAALTVETYSALTWLDNGDLQLVVGETRQNYALYRIGTAGDLHRIGAMPFGRGAVYSIARDGLHAIASFSDPHGDVWLVKNFGKMLRP